MPLTQLGFPYPDRDDATTELRDKLQQLAEAVDAAPGIFSLTTSQRDSLDTEGKHGMKIWNLDTARTEYWDGAAWRSDQTSDHQAMFNRDALDAHEQYLLRQVFTGHLSATDPHVVYMLKSWAAAKGDLPVALGPNSTGRLPIGPRGSVLKADPNTTTGLAWGAGAVAGWSVYISASTTVFNNQPLDIYWNAQISDSDNYVIIPGEAPVPGQGLGALMIPSHRAGYYSVSAGVQFAATAGAQGFCRATLYRDGSDRQAIVSVPGSSAQTNLILAKSRLYLAGGQTLKVTVEQNAGTAREISGGDDSLTWFAGAYLGAL